MEKHCKDCEKYVEHCDCCRPMAPEKVEIGGFYYFLCAHIGCGTQLNKEWDYCPKCGQKIDWENAFVQKRRKR